MGGGPHWCGFPFRSIFCSMVCCSSGFVLMAVRKGSTCPAKFLFLLLLLPRAKSPHTRSPRRSGIVPSSLPPPSPPFIPSSLPPTATALAPLFILSVSHLLLLCSPHSIRSSSPHPIRYSGHVRHLTLSLSRTLTPFLPQPPTVGPIPVPIPVPTPNPTPNLHPTSRPRPTPRLRCLSQPPRTPPRQSMLGVPTQNPNLSQPKIPICDPFSSFRSVNWPSMLVWMPMRACDPIFV